MFVCGAVTNGCYVGWVCCWLCEQYGWSCLLIACQEGHLDVVKYLHGAGGEALLMMTSKVRLCDVMMMRRLQGEACG